MGFSCEWYLGVCSGMYFIFFLFFFSSFFPPFFFIFLPHPIRPSCLSCEGTETEVKTGPLHIIWTEHKWNLTEFMGSKNPGELTQTNESIEISMTNLASLFVGDSGWTCQVYRLVLMEEPAMAKMPPDLVIAFQLLLELHQDHGGKSSFSQQCSSAEVSGFIFWCNSA